MRMTTGMSNFSLMSNAIFAQAYASRGLVGSSIGTLAKGISLCVSCSFCEECRPGSSATTTTRPPLIARVGRDHERVHRDVQAHMLAGEQGTLAADRSAIGHLVGGLFVHGPLGVHLVVNAERFENLGRGRARIGGGDIQASFPSATRQSFVTRKEHPGHLLIHFVGQ
jgi:hypothetical protein